jgi:hypothetical protein
MQKQGSCKVISPTPIGAGVNAQKFQRKIFRKVTSMQEQTIQPELHARKQTILPVVALALSRAAKPAVLITLIIGIYLHFTRLFIGTEMLIKHIYTATFDAVFAIPMLLGAVAIFPAWKYIVFRNKFEKAAVAVTGAYFLLSVPLHVRTWLSQSTDYILVFPMWYSLLFLAYTSVMMFVWWRLRIS